MKLNPLVTTLFPFFLCVTTACAATVPNAVPPSDATTATSEESLPDAPLPAPATAPQKEARPSGLTAFSAVGVDVKIGLGGVGFDVATPLTRHFNLRAGASFYDFDLGNLNLLEDGFAIQGTLKLRSVNTCVDYYPMGDSFRISPAVTVYNGNNFSGKGLVPPGGTITLNDVAYTSSMTDPLIATFSTPNDHFGSKVAPSITMGVGSIVPRGKGKHWSIPVELGIEYISPPKLLLGLTGTACSSSGCASVATDPSTQANLQAQQKTLNDDIYNLRFYPIFSIGVGYKF